ncbi:HEL284Cp [Eremothecium sinecaudum]|uniref:Coatomer subunit beta n=1 Tax=Eremothecium sinecaudum TaxID=45286 RepID=A0A0X8HT58_9SACH|nr:HEL284Cp [Eremothecium sinecaudum]AMD20997.1 HEL284Cp [Eremothecium sinecaudum]
MTTNSDEVAYTLVYDPSPQGIVYSVSDFQKSLEKGSDNEKIDTMKKILVAMLDGNSFPELLMHIIRFVMPSKNKKLKKLLYFYWEIVPKLDSEGKLKQEMILVCNSIQHDLQHPNEYIRGNTLRFLTKLKEAELLEQMVPSVRACLEYRHAYVRKYAILAVYSIYKVSDHLIPDACDILDSFLLAETDPICKRNAFVSLAELDRESALNYLQSNITSIESLDSLLQDTFIEFIRRDAIRTPSLKPQYVELLQDILSSTNSNEVIYEAATALTVLTNNPTTLINVTTKLIDLAVKESDNSIKLIVLDKIEEIQTKNPNSLEDLTLDILRVLTCQDLDVREKALDISLELVVSRNVDDVVKLLKKELQSTVDNNDEKSLEYRQLLTRCIHQVATRFVEVSANVVSLLLEFIGELNSEGASGIISFAKEVIEKYPQLREEILQELIGAMPNIKSAKAYRGALWVLGEYSQSESDIQASWKHIRESVGELPILQSEYKLLNNADGQEEEVQEAPVHVSKGPTVLPDGTYVTESALTVEAMKKSLSKEEKDSRPPLRRFILNGYFYSAAVLSNTIVKLVLRFAKVSKNESIINGLKAEAMLILVSILRVGKSKLVEKQIDEDSEERIMLAIYILMEHSDGQVPAKEKELLEMAYLDATISSYKKRVSINKRKVDRKRAYSVSRSADPIDMPMTFRQFAAGDSMHTPLDTTDQDLELACKGGSFVAKQEANSITSRLKKIVPLTGFSDPVYSECYIITHQFDVVLEVLLVNQTKETLRNLHVQFATLGDLKIIGNPPSTNIIPHGFHRITVTVKVSSADTGVIFGNIIYDGGHGEDSRYVILNDVHVDTMDYIKPASCGEAEFRKMWNAFEWENKLTVKSNLPTLQAYLKKLVEVTHMKVLTPEESYSDENCRFLSCNLYSKSTFGEDALANICIEKDPATNSIIGEVRIRSKTQGLALTHGDSIAQMGRVANTVSVNSI